MWLSRAADSLNRVVHPASGALQSVGASVLVVLMLLTASDVTLRAFNRPILGAVDLTLCMMAVLVAFSLAYCAVRKGHVKVEVLVERLPQRFQAIIDSITGLFGLGLFSLITWQCFVYMESLFASKITSMILLIPSFPFAGLLGFGAAWFTLALLADFLDSLSQAVRR